MEIGERIFRSKWFNAQVEKEAARDEVTAPDLIGQLISIVAAVIIIAFFIIHQTRPTGFFTEDFGTGSAVLLYLMIAFGIIPPLIRFIWRRKNPSRPFDAASLALFFVGGLYFLIKFPFDFAHFAEPFPHALEFLIDWISATLAKWVIGIGLVASPFFSVYTYALYSGVKKRLSGSAGPAPGTNP